MKTFRTILKALENPVNYSKQQPQILLPCTVNLITTTKQFFSAKSALNQQKLLFFLIN